jgi:hypothetical protein
MHNFEELSDYDFERLVADLLSAHWKVDVDTFPRGRDRGVDLAGADNDVRPGHGWFEPWQRDHVLEPTSDWSRRRPQYREDSRSCCFDWLTSA